MVNEQYKRIACVFATLILVFCATMPVEAARRSDGYSSSVTRAIRSLDEDPALEFAIPVLFGVQLRNLTDNFGDPRDGGARSHEGLDIMAKLGTPIVSPTEAVVTRFGTGESSGKYVYTANPGGETFRYMHLDDIGPIRAGTVLKAGGFIGTVGDTGNAKGGPAHLHFEIRKSSPTDPFPRIQEEFSFADKIKFTNAFFDDIDDEDDMAEFLVETYTTEFTRALNEGLDLPTEIESELKKRGIVSTSALSAQLEKIIASIPSVVAAPVPKGVQGGTVSLLQFFLIHEVTGPSAKALALAGPTGFFGPATEAAFKEYQKAKNIPETGIYDTTTRAAMLK